MSNKHTLGPWEYRGGFISDTKDEATIISGIPRWHKKHTRINDEPFGGFQNGFYWPTKEEIVANARLIAAAPELLEAVKDLLDIIHDDLTHARQADHHEALSAARAAIAKATTP